MMRRLLPVLALVALLVTVFTAAASAAPHCPPDQEPQFLFGFAHLQSLLKKHLEFRLCPILDFRLDEQLKESLATMALIDKVSSELAAKDNDAQDQKAAHELNQDGEDRSIDRGE